MRARLGLLLFMLVAVACGGGASADPAPTTAVQAAAVDLSGLSLEVHQAPG